MVAPTGYYVTTQDAGHERHRQRHQRSGYTGTIDPGGRPVLLNGGCRACIARPALATRCGRTATATASRTAVTRRGQRHGQAAERAPCGGRATTTDRRAASSPTWIRASTACSSTRRRLLLHRRLRLVGQRAITQNVLHRLPMDHEGRRQQRLRHHPTAMSRASPRRTTTRATPTKFTPVSGQYDNTVTPASARSSSTWTATASAPSAAKRQRHLRP